MNDNTEELIIGETTYILRRRLGWYEQEEIDGKAWRMFTDGKSLSQVGDDIESLESIEIIVNTPPHNLARLTARLVNVNRRDVKDLPPAHVPLLIKRITALEEEQAAEVAELQADHPTE